MVKIPVKVEPANGARGSATPTVEYRWDPDTEILSAQLSERSTGTGMSGSVELEGADGSWLILEVTQGRIHGVEIAVWPNVTKRSSLEPPRSVEDGHVVVPARKSQTDIASLEVEIALAAEADEAERIFHFTLGHPRQTRTFRLANDLLLDVDSTSNLVGVWLLNVPPFMTQAAEG